MMVPRPILIALWVLGVAAALVLTGANLYLGDLNQDEGWYLYAARLVSEGHLPYRDFAYTQAPVMPFVYALARPLTDGWGVAGGRLFTALLGLTAAGLAAVLAARLVDRPRRAPAALIAFMLVGINVYHSYFTSVVKTYSLSGLLLVLGFLAVTGLRRDRTSPLLAAAAGLALTLAAGTRVSAAVAVPIVFVVLIARWRGLPASWFWFGAGAGTAGAVTFLLPLFTTPDTFMFALFGYHSYREAGGLLSGLVYKAGFVSRLVQAYFVAVLLGTGVALARLLRVAPRDSADAAPRPFPLSPALWATVAAVTLVHISAPFPYEDYQVMVFPLFAAAVAAALARSVERPEVMRWLVVFVFVISVAASFSSPINQGWFVQERDRIWWRLKDRPPLAKLQDAGRRIRALARPGDLLLTQDTYLAVEAGLRVPQGLELGPFSYYPQWSSEKARRYHVVNREMLTRILDQADAPVAAFSGYGLAIESPQIRELPADKQEALWAAVTQRYEPTFEMERFGQGATRLRVLVRRPDLAPSAGAHAPSVR